MTRSNSDGLDCLSAYREATTDEVKDLRSENQELKSEAEPSAAELERGARVAA